MVDNVVNLVKNMSVKEGFDGYNLDLESSNQVDGSRKRANPIDIHQVTWIRSELTERLDIYQYQMVTSVKDICIICYRTVNLLMSGEIDK